MVKLTQFVGVERRIRLDSFSDKGLVFSAAGAARAKQGTQESWLSRRRKPALRQTPRKTTLTLPSFSSKMPSRPHTQNRQIILSSAHTPKREREIPALFLVFLITQGLRTYTGRSCRSRSNSSHHRHQLSIQQPPTVSAWRCRMSPCQRTSYSKYNTQPKGNEAVCG